MGYFYTTLELEEDEFTELTVYDDGRIILSQNDHISYEVGVSVENLSIVVEAIKEGCRVLEIPFPVKGEV